MRTLIGLMGLTMVGASIAALVYDWKVGVCVGLILMGAGLFIDSMRK